MQKPPEVYVLLFLHLLLGLNALAGGTMLIVDPQGELLGMPIEWLERTPFKTYLIPGIILLVFNGIFPFFILYGLLTKPSWTWAEAINIYRDKFWAWTYSLFSGIIVIIWIIVQQCLTHYFWLQPALISLGLLIIIFTMLPRVLQFYSVERS
jgi:hypothetical protein